MYTLIFFLYNGIFIPFFYAVIHLAALFNPKIKRGIQGRRGIFTTLPAAMSVPSADSVRIWIHVSSLGEFEQVKPVIRILKEKMPHSFIILSFFSPSGYDHAKGYEYANYITYLPADTFWNARKFVALIKPHLAVIVRHDIWPNFQWRLQRSRIPSLLINASIPPHRMRWIKWMRFFLRPIYHTFSEIFVTTEENARHFRIIYPFAECIKVLGDTRYDQVKQRASELGKIAFLQKTGAFSRRHCLVAGSTWPKDEKLLFVAIEKIMKRYCDFVLIVVPHEPVPEHIAAISDFFTTAGFPCVRLSQFVNTQDSFRVFIIDRIGLLANLYALGCMAYVGGGFGVGVHNVLEPAVHGSAVLFGPRHTNSVEAMQLLRIGAGRCVRHADDVYAAIVEMEEKPEQVERRGRIAQQFVAANVGAAERTATEMIRHLTSQGRSIHE